MQLNEGECKSIIECRDVFDCQANSIGLGL